MAKKFEFKEHDDKINFVDFGFENSLISSASDDGTCLIYSLKTNECLSTLTFAEEEDSKNL